MARIRHIALCADDPSALAEFYKATFGLEEIARMPGEGPRGVFLSDGEINLAIIPAHGGPQGINHFGFQVEDAQAVGRAAKAAGASGSLAPRPRDGRYVEVRLHDPVGTPVDLAEAGWATRHGEGLRQLAQPAS